jgi:hypothetical protein
MTIYFIQAGKDGPIKIGWSVEPERRLQDLQCAHYETLHIVRLMDAEKPSERLIHQMLQQYHIRGEWFRSVKEVIEIPPPLVNKPVVSPVVNGPVSAPGQAHAEAKRRVGGSAALGRLLGLTRQAVNQWSDKVPVLYVLEIERITGVSKHDLRPDIYPREDVA